MLITAFVAFATVGAKQTSTLTPPPKRHYKYDGKVVKSFDKTLDQTVIALELMAIKDVEDLAFDINFHRFAISSSDESVTFSMEQVASAF